MIWHDVVIVGKLFVADRAYYGLLTHLAVQKFSHFSRRPEFPISSWVVRIFDALNSQSYEPRPWKGLPAAAGKRLVNRAEFIATKPHGIPPDVSRKTAGRLAGTMGERSRCGWPARIPSEEINVEPG